MNIHAKHTNSETIIIANTIHVSMVVNDIMYIARIQHSICSLVILVTNNEYKANMLNAVISEKALHSNHRYEVDAVNNNEINNECEK